MRSTAWVLHLYAGDGDDSDGHFGVIPKGGKIILEVDSKALKLWDIHRKGGVYRMLLWAAAKPKITDVIGSPTAFYMAYLDGADTGTWVLSSSDYHLILWTATSSTSTTT